MTRNIVITNETLGRHIPNALALHDTWEASARKGAKALATQALRTSQAGRPQALPKWANSALLWYLTDGQAGLAIPHMVDAENVNMFSFIDDTDVDLNVRRKFAEIMSVHPSKEIARSWERELSRLPEVTTPAPKAKARNGK